MLRKIRSLLISASAWNDSAYPLLRHVEANDDFHVIEKLLNKRGYTPNLEIAEAFGETPLIKACQLGNEETVRLLIQYGANLNARSSPGMTPIMHAAECTGAYSYIHLVPKRQIFLENGTIWAEVPRGANHRECISWLALAGADINAQDKYGFTALMYSVGLPDLVEELLMRGATVNIRNADDRTALEIALHGRSGTAREAWFPQSAELIRRAGGEL